MIERSSGNAPISTAAMAQVDTNAMIKTFALEIAVGFRLSTRCIEDYSSPVFGGSGTISVGFRSVSETSNLIAPQPPLYM